VEADVERERTANRRTGYCAYSATEYSKNTRADLFIQIGPGIFWKPERFEIAAVFGREQLISANSRLVASTSVAGAVRQGLAGILMQLLATPLAVLIDAISFSVSAVLIHTIRSPEPEPASGSSHTNIWMEISDGLRPLYREPLLRSIVGSSMIYLFFSSILLAVYVLYTTRDLAITPVVLGGIYGLGGVGAAIGAVLAGRVAHHLGLGLTMIDANLIAGLFLLLPRLPVRSHRPPLYC
jgi:hypothetical protein